MAWSCICIMLYNLQSIFTCLISAHCSQVGHSFLDEEIHIQHGEVKKTHSYSSKQRCESCLLNSKCYFHDISLHPSIHKMQCVVRSEYTILCLGWGLSKFLLKVQITSILGFADYRVFVETTLFCHHSVKESVDDTSTNGCGCVPTIPYIQKNRQQFRFVPYFV